MRSGRRARTRLPCCRRESARARRLALPRGRQRMVPRPPPRRPVCASAVLLPGPSSPSPPGRATCAPVPCGPSRASPACSHRSIRTSRPSRPWPRWERRCPSPARSPRHTKPGPDSVAGSPLPRCVPRSPLCVPVRAVPETPGRPPLISCSPWAGRCPCAGRSRRQNASSPPSAGDPCRCSRLKCPRTQPPLRRRRPHPTCR